MKVIVMCISGHMASRRYWTAAGRQRRVSMSLLLYITSDAPVSQTWHWRQPSSIDDRLVGIRQWIKIPANAWLHHDVSSALGDCFQPSSTIPHNNKTAPHAVALLYLYCYRDNKHVGQQQLEVIATIDDIFSQVSKTLDEDTIMRDHT